MSGAGWHLTAEDIKSLLDELGVRLARRGLSVAIYVVGGAAIAVRGVRQGRLTADVDGLTQDEAVFEESRTLARERGIADQWLNARAAMWMPPLPPGVMDPPPEPGLRVTYADDSFLLATKLVAFRLKDTDDLVALATRIGLFSATPDQVEAHIRSHYTDEAALASIIGGPDPDHELKLLATDAARFLSQRVR